MTILPVALFNQAGTISGNGEILYYPEKSIALIPMPSDPKQKEEWLKQKAFTLYDITEVFTDFTGRPDSNLIFTHLGGGIGDVLAFSAVAEYLRGRSLTVHCLPKHHILFKWYTNQNIHAKGMYEPIFENYTPANRLSRYSKFVRLRMEYAAIEGREVNWYDAMFARMGIPTPDGLNRPQLRVRPYHAKFEKRSILIQHRASCQIRSSNMEDFYIPVREAYPTAPIYVYERDLTKEDIQFCKKTSIRILPDVSIEDYLIDLQDFNLVVSTDSAATHFREGIGKPCLTAFGAMTADSRTRGYIHTRSFDVKTGCQFQPCFKHQMRIDDFCPARTPGENIAKCQTGTDFQAQLYTELKAYHI